MAGLALLEVFDLTDIALELENIAAGFARNGFAETTGLNAGGVGGGAAVAAAPVVIGAALQQLGRGQKRKRDHSEPDNPEDGPSQTVFAIEDISESEPEDTSEDMAHRRISTGPMKRANLKGGEATEGGEVAVVPPPKQISKIHPDYITITLPYFENIQIDVSKTNGTSHTDIRLNSIYDPIVGTVSNTQPQGRDNWAQNFQFYRVLGTNVKLTLINGQTAGGTTNPNNLLWAWGYELIEAGAAVANGIDMFQTTKHAKRAIIGPAASTFDNFSSSHRISQPAMSVLTHEYHPESWDYHVHETGIEERWTPVGANPTNEHYMALRFIGYNGQDISTFTGEMHLHIAIEYHVQFREVESSLLKTPDSTVATYPDLRGFADL